MKKFNHIWVGYGKNKNYVCAEWVHEDAVEAFKAEVVAKYRERGWMKDFCFIENMEPCVADENGFGSIWAIGEDGKHGVYRVA